MIIDCRPTDETKHTDRYYLVADVATETYPNDTSLAILEISLDEYCALLPPHDDDEYDKYYNAICDRLCHYLASDWFFDRYKIYTHKELQRLLFK